MRIGTPVGRGLGAAFVVAAITVLTIAAFGASVEARGPAGQPAGPEQQAAFSFLVRFDGGSPSSTVNLIDSIAQGVAKRCPEFAQIEEVISENPGFATTVEGGCIVRIQGDADGAGGNIFRVRVRSRRVE